MLAFGGSASLFATQPLWVGSYSSTDGVERWHREFSGTGYADASDVVVSGTRAHGVGGYDARGTLPTGVFSLATGGTYFGHFFSLDL